MKVYISGFVLGSYRAQNIIKSFLDNEITCVYLPQTYFKKKLRLDFLNKCFYLMSLLLSIPFRFFLIAISTHLFLLPMNTSLIAMLEVRLAKFLGKKVLVDFYISQFDTLVNDRKVYKSNSWGGRKAYHKDRLLMRWADKIIFLNKAESTYYQSVVDMVLSNEKIEIIPLCVDYRNGSIEKNGKSDSNTLNICWWGTYIPLHGLEVVFKAMSLLNNKNIKLYVFGDSDVKSIPYKKVVESIGLVNQVEFENNYSFNNGKLAPKLIEKCDLTLGNFGNSIKAKTVLVNKVVDSLALGLPCLTSKTAACEELLDEFHGVIYCEANAESIAQKINHLYDQRERLKKIGEQGKEVFMRKFNFEVFSANLLKAIY